MALLLFVLKTIVTGDNQTHLPQVTDIEQVCIECTSPLVEIELTIFLVIATDCKIKCR